MNLYYEIFDIAGEPYYLAQHNVRIMNGVEIKYDFSIMLQSHRVWREDRRGVIFFKHREKNVETVVDIEEFMWIKLQAKPI